MNRVANIISNRLSLRRPQRESLDILTQLTGMLTMEKGGDLAGELEKVRKTYPTCTDFERAFPSVAFGIATGVGKTRLMGAFITYLYLEHGIKNFFVMAPNLTIYNKLIEDFSNPNHPKYVFKGIGEFAQKLPRIITGDNYASQTDLDFYSDVSINVFNISKLNAETRSGNEPRIKRLSECLGESYFNYLANLEDLVLLMDESHHYRAARGMTVINELNPILGLELTATPKTEQAGKSVAFKNVVYEYSLAKAIKDGFVKQPAVATRKDFDPEQYRNVPEELDRIKLEDGIRIHEATKVALEIYSRNNKASRVKPFVLVVAKNTAHAGDLKKMIVSDGFFDAYYADKVMEIHSSQHGAEKEENIEQLLSLENPDNKIEIVIHVNMLKEGWDVNNLYTIIPLRTSASETLTEQTIGRGLRLPYGTTTGDAKVDMLTIVSHDKFQAIIDKANEADSIIRKENVIVINEEELKKTREVVSVPSKLEEHIEKEAKIVEQIEDTEKRQQAHNTLQAKKEVLKVLPVMNTEVSSLKDLRLPEIKKIAIEKIRKNVEGTDLFADQIIKESEFIYDEVAEEFDCGIIAIPEIPAPPGDEMSTGFNDFDLNTEKLSYQPVSEEIMRKNLADNTVDSIIGRGRISEDSLENLIINELKNYPEIDYDEQAELLFKLATQAIDKFESYLNEDDIQNAVQHYRRDIAKFIYNQMMENFYCKVMKYQDAEVRPFVGIEEHNFSKYNEDGICFFRDTINPIGAIPSKVFGGFEKSCHSKYKFDSRTEKNFAIILEDDKAVLKWLRPAHNQFNIYWNHNSSRYEPDFVVETDECIYLIETKKEGDIDAGDVQEKTQAALEYCAKATRYTTQNNGKPWKYILIPHTAVMHNSGFDMLSNQYEVRRDD
ncbi:MAG: DEAD/DEAH box helicase family protein [Victivallaceae bacterium]|nr:DEAD/DEAH box helicase family protein [Victivallaceae bacterium]